jgi:hypothetical protein
MSGSTTATKTRMIYNSVMCWHNVRKVAVEGGEEEAMLHDIASIAPTYCAINPIPGFRHRRIILETVR